MQIDGTSEPFVVRPLGAGRAVQYAFDDGDEPTTVPDGSLEPAPSVLRPRSAPEPRESVGRRRWILFAAAGAALLVLGVVASTRRSRPSMRADAVRIAPSPPASIRATEPEPAALGAPAVDPRPAVDGGLAPWAGEEPTGEEASRAKDARAKKRDKEKKKREAAARASGAERSVPDRGAASDAPFDRAAAVAVLESATESSIACETEGGARGKGRIAVTFAANGHALSAELDDGPLRGTLEGKCLEATFGSLEVPAFAGGTVTVHKTVTLP